MLDRLNAALADRYTVERELGRGGMASVWLARGPAPRSRRRHQGAAPELAGAIGVDRFVREMRLTARLQHPNIVPVLDSGVFPGPTWRLRSPGTRWRTSPANRCALGSSASATCRSTTRCASPRTPRALQARAPRGHRAPRHQAGEPAARQGERVYVVDFGIAKALIDTGGERLTEHRARDRHAGVHESRAGLRGAGGRAERPVQPRDVLYEMLVGEPPFTGPTAQAVVARRLAEPARADPHGALGSAERASRRGAAGARARAGGPVSRRRGVRRGAAARIAVRCASPARGSPPSHVACRRWHRHPDRGHRRCGGRRGCAHAPHCRRASARTRHRHRARIGTASFELRRRTPAGSLEAIAAFREAVRRDSPTARRGRAREDVRAHVRAAFRLPGVSPRQRAAPRRHGGGTGAGAIAPNDAEAWARRRSSHAGIWTPTDRHRPAMRCGSAPSRSTRRRRGLALPRPQSGRSGDAGRRDAGLATLASAADPTYTQGLAFLALGHMWRRQYDSAARWADSAIAVQPNYLLARGVVGVDRHRTR